MDIVAEFNKNFQVGDKVDYTDEKGEVKRSTTRWHAEDEFGGIVWIKGELNAVPLNRVSLTPINESNEQTDHTTGENSAQDTAS